MAGSTDKVLLLVPVHASFVFADLASYSYPAPFVVVYGPDDARLASPRGRWLSDGAVVWLREVQNMLFFDLPSTNADFNLRMNVITTLEENGVRPRKPDGTEDKARARLLGKASLHFSTEQLRQAAASQDLGISVGADLLLKRPDGQWHSSGKIELSFAVRTRDEAEPLRQQAAYQTVDSSYLNASQHPGTLTAAPSPQNPQSALTPYQGAASSHQGALSPIPAASGVFQRSPPSPSPYASPHGLSGVPPADPTVITAVQAEVDKLRAELSYRDQMLNDVRAEVERLKTSPLPALGSVPGGAADVIANPPPTLIHFADFDERIKQLRGQEKLLRDALQQAHQRQDQLKAASSLPMNQRKRIMEAMEHHRSALTRLDEAAEATRKVFAMQHAADAHRGLHFRAFAESFARDVAAEVADQVLTTVKQREDGSLPPIGPPAGGTPTRPAATTDWTNNMADDMLAGDGQTQ